MDWRAVTRAQIPAVKESVGLLRQDGKCPDGATLIPWAKGISMAWDVCHSSRHFAESLSFTATQQGAAVKQAADNMTAKYQELEKTYIFFPVAIKTTGSCSQQDIELVQEIGRHISAITEDNRETFFLLQRLSVALQKGNAVSFLRTFLQD